MKTNVAELKVRSPLSYLDQLGAVFALTLIVLTSILVVTMVLISNSFTFKQSSRYTLDNLEATALAEAGIDKAVASLNRSPDSYNGESETLLGDGSYSVAITTVSVGVKQITATGYVPNKDNPRARSQISIQISQGDGISFNYGVLVGQGGLSMSNNSRINGSVYSNGNITMDNGSTVTGDAYVAGGTQPNSDQSSECSDPNCADYEFGKTTNGQLDIAQGFRPASTLVINKVSLKLKKIGSPSDVVVRILADNNGSPNKNAERARGTLYSNLVTNQYGWVDIGLNTNPVLNAGTPYWIVLDTTASSTNYWNWSTDSLQGYTPLGAKWSANWQASSPVWNSINGDLGFKTFMGGVATSITGANNSLIQGNAYANTLNTLRINQHAYYQVQNNLTVNGSSCTNNANCHPGATDPAPQPMPVSDANIQEWKDAALAGGTQNGVTGCPATMAGMKYIGDVTLSNNCISTVNPPIWITGNLILDNGSLMRLNPSYGASSGVIIVDGTIKLSNNGRLQGSGTAGSYLMALSTYDSRQNGNIAIESDNGSNSMVLYAGNGRIKLSNNAQLKEVTAWRIDMDNGSAVTYETGLSGLFFSSGPQGSFSVIKGTYQLK